MCHLMGLFSFLGGLRLLERLRLKYEGKKNLFKINLKNKHMKLHFSNKHSFKFIDWQRPFTSLHFNSIEDSHILTFLQMQLQTESERANLLYPLSDKVHVHGALASSVSPRTVSASGTTAMAFSAAAFLSFAAPAPLFTLLFVSAPTSSLPGAWTSAPAPTSPFPEIVEDNAKFWKLLLFIHLFYFCKQIYG